MCACTFSPTCTAILPCGYDPCRYNCCPPPPCCQTWCPPPCPCTPCPPCNCCPIFRPGPPPCIPDLVPPIVPILPPCRPRRCIPIEKPAPPPSPVVYCPPALPCCPPPEPCELPPVRPCPEPIACYQPVLPCCNIQCPPPILPKQRPICPRAPPAPYPCCRLTRSYCPCPDSLDPVTRRRPLICHSGIHDQRPSGFPADTAKLSNPDTRYTSTRYYWNKCCHVPVPLV